MRCPKLSELPPPPPRCEGWPWTVETPPLPGTRPDGAVWPRVSVVTPSYNQGQFIEETIRSVLLQGYPDIEYFIMDGGSTDGTVEIIKKYQPWLTKWASEKDRGQAHAINKGFARATGTIGAYLNSDDFYLPGAMHYAADSFARIGWDLLIGRCEIAYRPRLRWLRRSWWMAHKLPTPPRPFVISGEGYQVRQESTFWNRTKFAADQFDESLHFCMDLDWYCRIARNALILLTSRKIGHFRMHEGSKTANLQHVHNSERQKILARENDRGIASLETARIFRAFRRKQLALMIERARTGTAEYTYVHPM